MALCSFEGGRPQLRIYIVSRDGCKVKSLLVIRFSDRQIRIPASGVFSYQYIDFNLNIRSN